MRAVRPKSAVSSGVGFAGLIGLFAWLAIARLYGMDGPSSALTCLLACGLPMVGWSLLVDKVYRNPSTGIDWSLARPLRQTLDVSLVKIAGLWATWAGLAILYMLGRWYWSGSYEFAMDVLETSAPWLLALSIPYVLWLDRYLIEPRDGAYAFGAWLIGHGGPEERARIPEHLRQWAVKGFFLAFMLSIVPGGFGAFVRAPLPHDLVSWSNWLVTILFIVDVQLATVGYMLTCRPLDAQIRSANPFAAGWVAALACYPPFSLMGSGGPIDHRVGTADWNVWLAGHPLLLATDGVLLVLLTGIYAWATVAFGLRFSNLTNRGILTNGPYAWVKHPAYLAKNSFWWLVFLPFFVTTGNPVDAVRNCACLAIVNGIYFWRAKTEEAHLRADPAYRAYEAWIAEHGLWARLRKLGRGRSAPELAPAE